MPKINRLRRFRFFQVFEAIKTGENPPNDPPTAEELACVSAILSSRNIAVYNRAATGEIGLVLAAQIMRDGR